MDKIKFLKLGAKVLIAIGVGIVAGNAKSSLGSKSDRFIDSKFTKVISNTVKEEV